MTLGLGAICCINGRAGEIDRAVFVLKGCLVEKHRLHTVGKTLDLALANKIKNIGKRDGAEGVWRFLGDPTTTTTAFAAATTESLDGLCHTGTSSVVMPAEITALPTIIRP